ncbi:MAG: CsoR family transcriptional regulator, copper-sensing transcriptional repressor [Thermotogaceae bacterium]|jgi:DNA-binding FrmR family transcriptional regulator|nr:CsoR family transcriptional regulator, copper-sensing transcriptional repressor [Thermotogaceae bacterium]
MDKDSIILRLKKVEGQVRGIRNMVESERDCKDILIQVTAAKSALNKIAEEIMRDYTVKCLGEIQDADKVKVDDLVKTIVRFIKS